MQRTFREFFAPPPGAGRLPALDGLRALAAIWVIGLHTVSMAGSFWVGESSDVHVFGPAEFARVANSGLLRLLVKGDMAVDAFFVLSGFLIATILFREEDRTGTIDLGRFYRDRLLRLAPAYFVTLLLFAVLGRGDVSTAWANLLYVNNFVPTYRQLMLHAWSLAVEEQFYLLFPLLLLVLRWAAAPRAPAARTGRPSGRFWTTLILVGLAIRAVVVVRDQLWLHTAANPIIDRDACAVFNDALYDKFYTRYGSIVCGVAAAQAYATGGAARFFARPFAPIACLAASIAVAAVVCSPAPVAQAGAAAPSPTEVGVFLVVYQTAFSAATAFLVLACAVRWRGARPLESVLSWRGWYAPAKLSYGAYLLHPLLIERAYVAWPPRASPVVLLAYFAAFTASAFVLAVPLHLFVEAPGLRLRGALARRVKLASEAAQ